MPKLDKLPQVDLAALPAALQFAQFAKAQHLTVGSSAYRAFAKHSYRNGQFSLAATYFIATIQAAEAINVQDCNELAAAYYAHKNFDLAIAAMEVATDAMPDNPGLLTNLGIMLKRVNRWEEAQTTLEKSLTIAPDQTNTLDALCHLYGHQGQLDAVKRTGTQTLTLKAQPDPRITIQGLPEAPECPRRDFSFAGPRRQIIAFSLWGQDTLYYHGALLNALLTPLIYPGWCCRFYCDASVSNAFQDKLKQLGAEVAEMQTPCKTFEGLFWRFLVADDPTVDRYLIRDCDCVVNVRERAAVADWIQSGQPFHLMRDFYSHSELILAGLWGGIQGALPPMVPMINAYLKVVDAERTIDQRFLRHLIWPYVKDQHLAHDGQFGFGHAVDFPPAATLLSHQHVGQRFDHFLPELVPLAQSLMPVSASHD